MWAMTGTRHNVSRHLEWTAAQHDKSANEDGAAHGLSARDATSLVSYRS